MSRRFKLGILTKNKHEQIKDLSFKELRDRFGDEEGLQTSKLSKEVFNIGKSFDDSFLKKFSTPAFESREVHNLVNEDDAFYLINQAGLKALIENFRSKIADNFKELLGDGSEESDKKLQDARFSYIYFRLQEWGNDLNITPYNLEGETLTNSGNLEHEIFELVRIYKTVNWDTHLVSISAW